jgi:hypothetical protein
VAKQVDELTGLLANPGCPAEDAYFEWYIAGTEPLAECAPRAAGGRPEPIKDTRPARKQPPAASPAVPARRP